jgi:hypothetical protein
MPTTGGRRSSREGVARRKKDRTEASPGGRRGRVVPLTRDGSCVRGTLLGDLAATGQA